MGEISFEQIPLCDRSNDSRNSGISTIVTSSNRIQHISNDSRLLSDPQTQNVNENRSLYFLRSKSSFVLRLISMISSTLEFRQNSMLCHSYAPSDWDWVMPEERLINSSSERFYLENLLVKIQPIFII